ncbi:hypothetical protein PCASD_24996, partial [Puccinia coronata f. sp. avenae]
MRLAYVVAGLIAFSASVSEARVVLPNGRPAPTVSTMSKRAHGEMNSTNEDVHPSEKHSIRAKHESGEAGSEDEVRAHASRKHSGSSAKAVFRTTLYAQEDASSSGDHPSGTHPKHLQGIPAAGVGRIASLGDDSDDNQSGNPIHEPALALLRAIEDFREEVSHENSSPMSSSPLESTAFPVPLASKTPAASPVPSPALSTVPVIHDSEARTHPLPGSPQAGSLPSRLSSLSTDDLTVPDGEMLPVPAAQASSPASSGMSNLPVLQSTAGESSGIAASTAQDPSKLINRVFSSFPSVQPPLAVGNPGAQLSSLSVPVDSSNLVTPPVAQPSTDGNSGAPSSAPSPSVNPSNLVSPDTSSLRAAQSAGAASPVTPLSTPALQVDPSNVTMPVTPASAATQLSAAGSTAVPVTSSSLPVDPLNMANRVSSNVPAPLSAAGTPDAPLATPPVPMAPPQVDPSTLTNTIISNSPAPQPADAGNGAVPSPIALPASPSTSANPILPAAPLTPPSGIPSSPSPPVDPSSLTNRVTSNMPATLPPSANAGAPLAAPSPPVDVAAVDPSTLASASTSPLPAAQVQPSPDGSTGAPPSTPSLPVDPSTVNPSNLNPAQPANNESAGTPTNTLSPPVPAAVTPAISSPPAVQPTVDGSSRAVVDSAISAPNPSSTTPNQAAQQPAPVPSVPALPVAQPAVEGNPGGAAPVAAVGSTIPSTAGQPATMIPPPVLDVPVAPPAPAAATPVAQDGSSVSLPAAP